jgi:hypothetical protein
MSIFLFFVALKQLTVLIYKNVFLDRDQKTQQVTKVSLDIVF